MVPNPSLLLACAVALALAGWGGSATAWRLHATLAPQTRPAWRTPLLKLHVQTLRPSPRAGLSKPSAWLRPPLRLVKPDCEGS